VDRRQGGYWGSGDNRDGGDGAVGLLDGGGDRSAGRGAGVVLDISPTRYPHQSPLKENANCQAHLNRKK